MGSIYMEHTRSGLIGAVLPESFRKTQKQRISNGQNYYDRTLLFLGKLLLNLLLQFLKLSVHFSTTTNGSLTLVHFASCVHYALNLAIKRKITYIVLKTFQKKLFLLNVEVFIEMSYHCIALAICDAPLKKNF